MSELFNKCIPIILQHEGGLVDNPNDTGGITNFGISLRFLRDLPLDDGDVNNDGVINGKDIKDMTIKTAMSLYKYYFWNKNYEEIKDEALVLNLFDMAVNAGESRAVKLLQEVIGVKADGKLGPITIEKLNRLSGVTELYMKRRIKFYRDLVAKNLAYHIFLVGWENRVNTTYFS